MMRWSDVNYLDHDCRALVRFDGPHAPGSVHTYRGVIECPWPGALAILLLDAQQHAHVPAGRPTHNTSPTHMNPPGWARVLLLVPDG